MTLLSDADVGLAPPVPPAPPRLLTDAEAFAGGSSAEVITGIMSSPTLDDAIGLADAALDAPRHTEVQLSPKAGTPTLLSDEDIGLRLSDATVATRRAAGESIAEAQRYSGFWDRAKQTFREHATLDENVLATLFRRTLGAKQIDPATGRPYTEDQIRGLQNERRARQEYLLAGQEPAEGVIEHTGDFAGVVAKETTAPSALLTAPIGGAQRGLARAATMAAAGGVYETAAGAAEQIARDDEITDPSEIALRGVTGTVAAPVLDVALRKAGEGVAAVGRKAVSMSRGATQRHRGGADEVTAGTEAEVHDAEPVAAAAMEREGILEAGEAMGTAPGAKPFGDRGSVYRAISEELSGDSHLGPVIETATKTIDEQGPERGRAALREMLERDAADVAGTGQPGEIEPELLDRLVDELGGEIESRLSKPTTGGPRAPAARETSVPPTGHQPTAMELAMRKAQEKRAEVEAKAHEAATSPANDLPEPTARQEDAENFRHGHVTVQGLDVSISHPRGSKRAGVSPDGTPWRRVLFSHYGRIKRTEGADGENIDVFVGRDPDSERVFVVDQVKPDSGEFDEAKVMLGYPDAESARRGYLQNYPRGWQGIGEITETSVDDFKSWLRDGDTEKPYSPGLRQRADTTPEVPEPSAGRGIESPPAGDQSNLASKPEPEAARGAAAPDSTETAAPPQRPDAPEPSEAATSLPDVTLKDGTPFETERGAAMAKRMRRDVDLVDYEPTQVGPGQWVLRHTPVRAASPERGFEITPQGEGMIRVKGERAQIREALADAGVTFKGIAHRSGGLVFSRKHEGAIRAVLNPRDELELPGDIAHQWMPGERHIGMVNDATLQGAESTAGVASKAGKPIRREDILAPFTKALGLSLYQGRVKSSKTLGFYRPQREEVRIKKQNDIEVAAHEIAHAIDDRVPEVRAAWMKGPMAKVYREELRAVSYDKSKIYEGQAEAFRLLLTQPEKAREVLPEYSKWFDNFVKMHKYGPALREAQKGMTAWFRQGAIKRAASKIGQGRNVNEALYAPLRAFRQAVSDDLDGIYRMERELTGEISPAGMYETARLTRASYSMVEGALTLGHPVIRPDGSFAFDGKGLQQILQPVSDDLDNWTLYAVGRSANELRVQGREKLFTPTEIEAMRALETPAFKKAFDEYQEWNRAVVDFAEGIGLINPETRKLWRRAQYLPFHRVGQGGAGGSGSGPEGTWAGIKQLTGGTGNIKDVLGNMIQNAGQLMTAALRNDARVRVANMADRVRGGGRFMAKIPKISKAVTVSREEIMRVVREAGITDDMARVLNELDGSAAEDYSRLADFVTMFQHAQAPAGKNLVAVYRSGKPEYYEVIDPILMRSFAALQRPAKNWLVRFLNGVRRIGQSSITITADFMAANMVRDTLMGGIMSRHGFRPFIDSIRGMKSRVTKDPAYREFIANGGGFSSHLVDEQAFKKHLERFYAKHGINANYVIDAPGKLLYFMETLVDAFEMSTRLGEFKRARAAGAHPRHAAYSAREVSTDFGMRGDSEVLDFFCSTVMFLKAGVNGIDRSYRGFAHDPNRVHIATRTGVLALTSMALYAYNRRFEEYRDMEDWKKDSYWHFFITKADGGHHHFLLPKIWEIGSAASIAERTLEHLLEGDLAEYSIDFARIVMNQFKFDYMPHAFAPLYEQYLNRSRFTGQPIETMGMESLAPFARAKPYTAETIKELGLATRNLPRQLQIPPARAEALLRGYFNTWAMYGLTLTDALRYDDQPDLRVDQYPVLRRFYSADPERHTRHEEMYYDMLKEATELRRTLRHLDKINRPDIADEMEKRPPVGRYDQLNNIHEELQGINNEMFQVQIDPTLTPAEKRQRLDGLTTEKNDLLKLVVEDVEAQETTGGR